MKGKHMSQKKRIGWKIVDYRNSRGQSRTALLKLQILGPVVEPYGGASVETGGQRMFRVKKLRTSKVKVLQAFKLGSDYFGGKHRTTGKLTNVKKFHARYASSFKYVTGKIAQIPKEKLDRDPGHSCSSGLHFFDQRRHAIWWANC